MQVDIASNIWIFSLSLSLLCASVVTMAFTFSPLFQKATSAGAMGSLLIILFVIPYIPFGISGFDIVHPALIWILCLFSPTAVAIFFDRVRHKRNIITSAILRYSCKKNVVLIKSNNRTISTPFHSWRAEIRYCIEEQSRQRVSRKTHFVY